ncbi:phosphotriesterase-related protein [Rhodococcus sp. OK519]|uniref:phosphotriesterase family protein n=1 Tax=Rhodococcus sp. OK519 TaxID=2135729 RepID=UPI000D34962B|nr:phosphotriesterase-related protein [Rhodococcus sp. OK519]
MPVHGVHGPIERSELGQTLIHEHIVTADWSMRMAFGDHYYNHDVVVSRAVEQFSRAAACGVRTVVDATPVNMGRDVRLICEVAERTGLNFIVSSGFYHQDEVYLTWRTEDEIHELLSRECQEGIAGTNVRPGIMKAACADHGITPILDKVFRAIGRVAAEQRLPIFCHHHTDVGNGDAIVDLFESCGVAPSRLVLGHSGDTNDLRYLEKMLARGCYLGMDRFGHCAVSNSLEDRVRTIVDLCALGYGDRLLLSHDLAIYFGVSGSWQEFESEDSAPPGVDFTFIHRQVLPALEAAGLAPEEVRAMLERNPVEFLAND